MKIVVLLVIIISSLLQTASSQTPTAAFTTIEGATLGIRLETAIKQGQARGARFWTAYSFDVRPNITMDSDVNLNGNSTWVNGIEINSQSETRHLAFFQLHEASGNAISRYEIYNLDRKREYSGVPVYWLGRASNEESLNFLKGLVGTGEDKLKECATQAIALHDDQRVGAMLKELTKSSNPERVRKTAIFWLGHVEGEREFLADFVRNEQESIEIRKQAAFGIGINKDKAALPLLRSLYASVASSEVKRQLIFAASISEDKDAAVDFLINVASSDQDRELRKKALFWLGQKAGERSLKFLGDVAEKNEGDTEVQKQAVFALSQRQKSEAIPKLIEIAKTHQNLAVRKQAIFWLGQSGDDRAVAYFKELFTK